MTRRFAFSLAVLAVGAALVGGCGSSSDSKNFKKDYKALRQDLRSVGNELGAALRAASAPGQTDLTLAQKFDGVAGKTKAVLDRLRKLKPTDNVKSEYEQLKSALSRAQKDVKAIATALRAHNVSAARSTTQALLRDSPAVTKYANATESKLK